MKSRSEYKQIYPQLSKFWGASLAELPGELQDVARKATHPFGWDSGDVESRQNKIRAWDWHHDPTLEAQTWHALFQYGLTEQDALEHGLGDASNSPLTLIINNAIDKDKPSVAVKLKTIQSKISEILKENTERWDVTEPQLWKSIYRLSQKELGSLLSEAEANKDYSLMLALQDVYKELERILNIDRERIGDDVTAEPAKPEAVPVATPKTSTNKKAWDDARLLALWNESILPGVNQTILAKKHGVTRQRIGVLLKEAKDKFSKMKSTSSQNKNSWGQLINK